MQSTNSNSPPCRRAIRLEMARPAPTPRGGYERSIFLTCLALILLTLVGLAINLVPEWRQVEDVTLVPVVAFWCGFNLVILLPVSMLCLQMPVRRQEERFALVEPVLIRHLRSGGLTTLMSEDMSSTTC